MAYSMYSTYICGAAATDTLSRPGSGGVTGHRVCTVLIYVGVGGVPDRRSQDLEVVVVRRIINLGTRNLEWGGNGKGLRKGGSVYE